MESPMATAVDHNSTVYRFAFTAWIPLVILPIGAVLLGSQFAPWTLMWMLALSIFAGLKWLSFADFSVASEAPIGRKLAYLFPPKTRRWLFILPNGK